MNAEQLLRTALERVAGDFDGWLSLFAENAVVEFPYAPSLGTAARVVGRRALTEYFAGLPQMEGLTFSNLRLYPAADGESTWAEVHGSADIPKTARRYEQDYVMFARASEGRLVHYREYWDPRVAAEALGMAPGGDR